MFGSLMGETQIAARRIKCDQQKPYCKRCTYLRCICICPIHSILIHRLLALGILARFQCDGYTPVSLADSALEDTKRSKALRFFLRKTRQQFGTFVSDELWQHWIPQIVYAEPCLRDAVAVLSLCHEDYISGRRSAISKQSTLLLYNRAIQEVRSSSHDVVLISLLSCAIFLCVEGSPPSYQASIQSTPFPLTCLHCRFFEASTSL